MRVPIRWFQGYFIKSFRAVETPDLSMFRIALDCGLIPSVFFALVQ